MLRRCRHVCFRDWGSSTAPPAERLHRLDTIHRPAERAPRAARRTDRGRASPARRRSAGGGGLRADRQRPGSRRRRVGRQRSDGRTVGPGNRLRDASDRTRAARRPGRFRLTSKIGERYWPRPSTASPPEAARRLGRPQPCRDGLDRAGNGGGDRLGQARTQIETGCVHGDDDDSAGESAEDAAQWQRVLDTVRRRAAGRSPSPPCSGMSAG